MKKLIGLLVGIVLVVGLAGLASAGTSDSITLKVACVVGLSVAIDKDEYNFGDVAPKIATISTETIQVTNDSGGRTEDYTINSSTSTQNWNIKAAGDPSDTEENLFSLQALLKSTQPSEGDFATKAFLNADAADSQNMTLAGFGTATDYDGDNVPDDADMNIWFRLHTPGTTSTQDEQSFSVTITANDASLWTP